VAGARGKRRGDHFSSLSSSGEKKAREEIVRKNIYKADLKAREVQAEGTQGERNTILWIQRVEEAISGKSFERHYEICRG